MLAECRSPNITEYYASVMLPGTTELLIIMELMASSVNDLVSPGDSTPCPPNLYILLGFYAPSIPSFLQ